MKYVLKNLTRRPVSILCNSGKSYHIPPKFAHEVSAAEIENNSFVQKLVSRKVISILGSPESKVASSVNRKADTASINKNRAVVKKISK